MDRAELDADKAIDPEALDVESVRHADLYFKWAERSVEAQIELEFLALDLDVLKGRLQMECREYPDRFNVKNITETAIKSAVESCPPYVDAFKKYLAAKGEKLMLEKAETAMEVRKRMLDNLIKLFGQEYFAGPAAPRDLVNIWKRHRGPSGPGGKKPPEDDRQRKAARKRGEDND